MEWNEKELLNQIDNYFKGKTKEEIMKDLEDTNSLQYIVPIEED